MNAAVSSCSKWSCPLACLLLFSFVGPARAQDAATVLARADAESGFYAISAEAGLLAYPAFDRAKGSVMNLVSLKTGKPAGKVTAGKQPITAPAFSGDGKTLGWLTSEGMIVLRDLASGKERSVLYREPTNDGRAPADNLNLSPDGRIAAVNGRGCYFVDLEAGKLIMGDIPAVNRDFSIALFTPDGKTALINGNDVYQVVPMKKLRTLSAAAEVRYTALSPDGTTLALTEPRVNSAELLKHIVLWDVTENKEKATFRIGPRDSQGRTLDAVAFSPDGKTLAFGFQQSVKTYNRELAQPSIGFLDASTGEALGAMRVRNVPRKLSYMPDGKAIVSECGFANKDGADVYAIPAGNAVKKGAEPVADLLVKGSVWLGEMPKMVFTILERDGESFKARFVQPAFDREVAGTIKDGKISWLAKDVQATRGNKGGDNEGKIFPDGTIDFVADKGAVRYTLKLKTNE